MLQIVITVLVLIFHINLSKLSKVLVKLCCKQCSKPRSTYKAFQLELFWTKIHAVKHKQHF